MANPNLIPSPLNRVRANVSIPAYPDLNVTASYLGAEGISVSFQGNVATQLMGLTSTINSEEPYVPSQIRISLIKSLALSSQWISQIQNSPSLGTVTVQSDTAQFPAITFYNCVITNIGDVSMAGKQAEFQITVSGYWSVSNDLWVPV